MGLNLNWTDIELLGDKENKSPFFTLQPSEVIDLNGLVRMTAGDDFSADTSTTGVMIIDGANTVGVIEEIGDIDWFAIEIDAAGWFRFELAVPLDNLNLEIYDSAGSRVYSNIFSAELENYLNFEALEGGTYYLAVDSTFSSETGSYEVNVSSLTDAVGNTASTAGLILADGVVTQGTIDFYGDKDWYAIEMVAGQQYTIEFDANGYQPNLGINTPGDGLGSQLFVGSSTYTFTAETSGTHYLSVQTPSSSSNSDYSISVTETQDDYSNDSSTSGIITVDGAAATGFVDYASDVDWLAVTVEAGEVVRFFVQSDANNAQRPDLEGRPQLSLLTADGFVLTRSGFQTSEQLSQGSTALTYAFAEAGTYYISYTGSRTVDGAYTITAESIDDEAGGTAETALTLATDGTVVAAGLQYEGDQDWFGFDVEAGQAITLTVDSDSPQDVFGLSFSIVDENGNSDGQFFFDILSDVATTTRVFDLAGTYYLVVNNDAGDIIDYNLNAIAQDDDFGRTLDSAGEMILGGGVEGEINYIGDEDWFRVTIDTPQLVVFELIVQDASFVGANIQVLDSLGNNIIDIQESGTLGVVAIFDIQTTGDFYVNINSIGSAVSGDDVVGTYQFSATGLTGNYVIGSPDNDTLNGTSAAESILGLFGNDRLNGLGGNDVINGGLGNDILSGGAGDDTLIGGLGNDTLDGGEGDDIASYAGAAAGIRFDFNGAVSASGEIRNDTLTSIEGVTGTAYSDVLYGLIGGSSILNGGGGDDFLYVNNNTTVTGGDGYDRVYAQSGSGSLDIDLGAAGIELVQGSRMGDILNAALANQAVKLFGNAGNDSLTGSAYADFINGGAGDDVINGGAGNDILDGLTNADSITAGAGDDIIFVDHLDTLIDGGSGYDRIYVRGYAEDQSYDLGAGNLEFANGNIANDTFDASTATWSVKLLGQGGDDTLIGGSGNDQLYGSLGDDIIHGGDGNDIISGGQGADDLFGGAGDDIIFVDSSDFSRGQIHGDEGYDRVYASGDATGISLNMTRGNIEFASGSNFADNIGAGRTLVDVKILGHGGNDHLFGGYGDDLIYGGEGNDQLQGDRGNDLLTGGSGEDVFLFGVGWGNDQIADFEDGIDLIRLRTSVPFEDLVFSAVGANNTLIEFGTDSILLSGVAVADIDASDFMFPVF